MARADYARDEVIRRGKQVFVERIQPHVGPDDAGKYLAINIETEEWAMGNDTMGPTARLHAEHPDAALYTMRIGYPATGRIGPRRFGSKV